MGFLTACGSSDSETSTPPQPTPTSNQAPQVAFQSPPASLRERSDYELIVTATDSDGTISSYAWSQTSGVEAELTFSDSTATLTTPAVSEVSTIVIEVTVTDDDGDTSTTSLSVDIVPNALPTIDGLQALYSVSPLESLTLSPEVADGDGDKLVVSAQVLSGNVEINSLQDGVQFVVAAPEDLGQEQISVIQIVVSDGLDTVTYDFSIVVPTASVDIVTQAGEFQDDDVSVQSDVLASVPNINSKGIYERSSGGFVIALSSESGAIMTDDLSIRLANDDGVETLTNDFTYNDTENTLTLKTESEDRFFNLIRNGESLLFLRGTDSAQGLVSLNIDFRYGFATLSGQLVDNEGNVYVGIAGQTLNLFGSFTGLTFTTDINSDSTFAFTDLPQDTYNLSLITPELEIVSDSVLVTTSTDQYVLSPVVIQIGQNSGEKQAKQAQEDTAATPERQALHNDLLFKAPGKPRLARQNVIGEIFVQSDTQGVPQINSGSFAIPEGVQSVTIETRVYSAEYPNYTTINSQYNDSWQYTYNIGLNTISKQGNVNSSHSSTGTVVTSQTFNVANLSNRTISLYARSTNIGDSAVDTTVTLTALGDQSQLVVNTFNHRDGLGNSKGRWYIGVGSNSTREWNATINYTPEDAMLIDPGCQYATSSGTFAITNANIITTSPGSATLSMGFGSVGSAPTSSTQGNISCEFSATTIDNGTIAATAPVFMDFAGGKDSIIPLIRYNDTARRFSGRDIGGDGWMRAGTLSFITNMSNLLYNDASREHGGCFVNDAHYDRYNTPGLACSKAIRDHQTHQTGNSIDVRYPTQHIDYKQRIALLEKNDRTAPEEQTLSTWLSESRAGIKQVTDRSDVKYIYVAQYPVLWNYLKDGVDANGDIIGDIGAWQNIPTKIIKTSGHVNHMHVEVK